jgi:large repetitive protein
MAKEITIAGHKFPEWSVYATAGVTVIAGVWYYKKRQASSASSSSSADPNAIDPVTGLPYSEDNTVDPLTGLTYLAEAEEYGSVAAAESAVSAASTSAGLGGGSGTVDTGGSTSNVGGTTTSTGSAFTTNQQWAASAVAALEALGYSSTESTAAIAAYLAGMSLTTTQTTLVQTALAELGPPPVGTFSITTTPAGSTSGGSGSSGTGTGTGTTTGAPKPKTGPITVTPVGLHTTSVGTTSAQVAWTAPTIPSGQGPLTGYSIEVYNSNGSAEGSPWTVAPTQLYANAGGLKSKTAYHINVWCDPATSGGPHATVSFTTT